jgi:hypothetical protein
MNFWKPLALVLTAAFGVTIGYGAASANPGQREPVSVEQRDYYHMRLALEHLRAARYELAAAEHNRGAWRERAVEATDRAIYETRVAMDW